MNKKKLISIGLVVVIAGIGIFASIKMFKIKKDNTEDLASKQQVVKQIPKEVSVRYAFADIDFDKLIQDVDKRDDDLKADYIFIRFTGAILPKRVKNSIMDVSNYKLDGASLPKGSEILIDTKVQNSELIIKLPNGILKGKNAGHVLEVSKDININDETIIKGNLKFNLPYSTKTTIGLSKEDLTSKQKLQQNSSTNNKNSESQKTIDNNTKDKELKENDNKSKVSVESKDIKKDVKYSLEIGKGIPFVTGVLVKLDVNDPEKYDVFVNNEKLKLKTNKEGKKIFVKGIKKDLSYEDVQDILKIIKIKK